MSRPTKGRIRFEKILDDSEGTLNLDVAFMDENDKIDYICKVEERLQELRYEIEGRLTNMGRNYQIIYWTLGEVA